MPTPATAPIALTARISPEGRLSVVASDNAREQRLAPDVAGRLLAAFRSGTGAGLLHLGAREVGTALPADLAFFRELGHAFMLAVRTLPELEERPAALRAAPAEGELARLVLAAPPMAGGEYLKESVLARLWDETAAAFATALREFPGPVADFLHGLHPAWNLVGRVHFHLAEQKADPARPFAFLATYTTRLSRSAAVLHVQLGQALSEYAGARDRDRLVSLLTPVRRAADRIPLIRDLADRGTLYHPLAWTPPQAYRFLQQVEALEDCGIVVRVPDWWRARGRGRPAVRVTIGAGEPQGLGLSALVDFSVEVAVEGEPLTADEWNRLRQQTAGLALIDRGGTPQGGIVEAFQAEDGPPFLVLSLKAGGTGLNLTAAAQVVHFDRWWNPAVEDQATDRAFRIGQRKNVVVHKMVCRGTVEERIQGMLDSKRRLSRDLLGAAGEIMLTELPDDELLRLVSLDLSSALAGS